MLLLLLLLLVVVLLLDVLLLDALLLLDVLPLLDVLALLDALVVPLFGAGLEHPVKRPAIAKRAVQCERFVVILVVLG